MFSSSQSERREGAEIRYKIKNALGEKFLSYMASLTPYIISRKCIHPLSNIDSLTPDIICHIYYFLGYHMSYYMTHILYMHAPIEIFTLPIISILQMRSKHLRL